MAKKLKFSKYFIIDYSKLPTEIQDKVDKQLHYLTENPAHPSLNLHLLQRATGTWEGYVDHQYRFTYQIEGEFYVLRRVGKHDVIKKP